VPVVVRAPLRWVSPNRVPADGVAPPRDRFLLRADGFLHRPSVGVFQRDRVLWTGGLPWLQPGRSANLPAGWLGTVDPAGEPVEVRVLAARRGR